MEECEVQLISLWSVLNAKWIIDKSFVRLKEEFAVDQSKT